MGGAHFTKLQAVSRAASAGFRCPGRSLPTQIDQPHIVAATHLRPANVLSYLAHAQRLIQNLISDEFWNHRFASSSATGNAHFLAFETRARAGESLKRLQLGPVAAS